MNINRLKVEEIGPHLYRVKLNCNRAEWEIIQVKAINEYMALFKALKGRFLMQVLKIR